MFYTDATKRQAALRALQLLVHYPDEQRQGKMLLLLGELQELEQQYRKAGETYLRIVTELTQLPAMSRLPAAQCLLRLSLQVPEEVVFQSHQVATTITQAGSDFPELGEVLVEFEELAKKICHPQERTQFSIMLGRLQIVLETLQIREDIGQHFQYIFLEELEAFLYTLYQIPRSGMCIISLYKILVGVDPLDQWTPDDNLNDLQKYKKQLSYVEHWLFPDMLAKEPLLIEDKASATRSFLLERERLSSPSFDKGTLRLIEMYHANSPAYGSATRWLIARAKLHSDEDHQAAINKALNERDPRERDRLLLIIFYDCFQRGDRGALQSFEKRFTPAVWFRLEQMVGRREATTVSAKDAQAFIEDVCKDVEQFCKDGQFKLACEHLLESWTKADDARVTDRIWQKLLTYMSSHQVGSGEYAFTKLLMKIMKRNLHLSYDPYLKERFLREQGFIEISLQEVVNAG